MVCQPKDHPGEDLVVAKECAPVPIKLPKPLLIPSQPRGYVCRQEFGCLQGLCDSSARDWIRKTRGITKQGDSGCHTNTGAAGEQRAAQEFARLFGAFQAPCQSTMGIPPALKSPL